ncbi:prenyltransferase/squalene oxidase repeat-containing protein [Iodidimonas sp. SYSU 1G8]|uniref:prenyltransferase/squalene oxidase repeat-containing protein n=1 Tax=Iodidimonas sp. SYSU 1G8 TaxID=3133967 RepID=UPI0031FF2BB6
MRNRLHRLWEWLTLPAPARRQQRADRGRLRPDDPGAAPTLAATLDWLDRAQDSALPNDGGLCRSFSLLDGWTPPCALATADAIAVWLETTPSPAELAPRARRALDWLLAQQQDDGGFAATDGASAAFVTGQAILALAAARPYLAGSEALRLAAGHLLASQQQDGSWPAATVRDTQTAWALMRADTIAPGQGFAEAANRALAWAMTQQRRNGWMASCCTDDPVRPLTVTIADAVRGFLECYRAGRTLRHLDAAVMAGWALVAVQRREDGSLPGRLSEKWEPAVTWSGLAGDAQAAICWEALHEFTGDRAFRDAARAAMGFVRRTIALTGDPDRVGGVRGSYPVDGGFRRFQYVSRAAALAATANARELAGGGTS